MNELVKINNILELKNYLCNNYNKLIEFRTKTENNETYDLIINGLSGYKNKHDYETDEERYWFGDEDLIFKNMPREDYVNYIIDDYKNNNLNCKYFIIKEF